MFNREDLAAKRRLRCFLQCAEWHRSAGRAEPLSAPSHFLLLFFDTRRRSALIAYRSLRHLTVTHTRGSTKKKKKKSPLLNSAGGGDIATRWDLFPNAHRWRCEAFGWEVRTARWIWWIFCFLCTFFLPGSRLRWGGGGLIKAMDYSVCLLLLLSTISSVSVGQFPTAQMWVRLQNSLLAPQSLGVAEMSAWLFAEFHVSQSRFLLW